MHEKAANSHFESTNAILQQSMIQRARKKQDWAKRQGGAGLYTRCGSERVENNR